MNISALPDLCYLLIFDRLNTQDMPAISRVCRRWNGLKIKACKQRHQLEIMVSLPSNTGLNFYEDKLLIPVAKIKYSILLKIVSTFGNVRKFTLNIDDPYLKDGDLLLFVDLLQTKKWSSNLVSFGLNFYGVLSISDGIYHHLIWSINKLPSLKHLEVRWNNPSKHIHLLTILPKLQSFAYHSSKKENFPELIRLLKLEFGRNTRLTTLESIEISGMNGRENGIPNTDALLSLDAGLARKITHFDYVGYMSDPKFKLCIEHFPMMKKVNFYICDNLVTIGPFTERFNHLAALQYLKELNLNLDNSESLVKLNPDIKFAPLPSVIKLFIWMDDNTPKKITSELAGSFPNLTYLTMDTHQCSDCNVCGINSEKYVADQDQQRVCIRHLAEPFQVTCAKLRKVIIIFAIHQKRQFTKIGSVLKPPFETIDLVKLDIFLDNDYDDFGGF